MRKRPRIPGSSGRRRSAVPPPPDGIGLEEGVRELRSSIANLRAAAEALEAGPGRRRGSDAALLGAIVQEAGRASAAVEELARRTNVATSRRPGPAPVTATRLVAEIRRRAALELDLVIGAAESAEARVVAPPEVVAALLGVLARLHRDFAVGAAELSTRLHGSLLSIDLSFAAREPEATRLADRHAALLADASGDDPGLAQAARSAGGEAWLAIRRGEPTFSLRVLLPRADAR